MEDEATAEIMAVPLILAGTGLIRGKQSDRTYYVYTSPSGSFRIHIPELLKPGTKVRDEAPSPGTLVVTFSDDLCREFVVTEQRGVLGNQSLEAFEAWVEENVVAKMKQDPSGIEVQGRQVLQTRYGTAISLRYRHPGAAPCFSITIREGRRIDAKPDADVGVYVLHANGAFYRLLYVMGSGLGFDDFGIKRGPVDEILARFADGFEIIGDE